MKEVEFTKDFADKKQGDFFKCDGVLASQLINVDKVAKLVELKEVLKEVVKSKKSK